MTTISSLLAPVQVSWMFEEFKFGPGLSRTCLLVSSVVMWGIILRPYNDPVPRKA